MLIGEIGLNGQPMSVSWPNFQDWQTQNDVLSDWFTATKP